MALSILVMIVIMKQVVWNTWIDTTREPIKMDLLVNNVINVRVKHKGENLSSVT